jgi:hypothetical protein
MISISFIDLSSYSKSLYNNSSKDLFYALLNSKLLKLFVLFYYKYITYMLEFKLKILWL